MSFDDGLKVRWLKPLTQRPDDINTFMKRTWTNEQLTEAIKTSFSKLEAIQKMGLKIPGSYKVVNKYIRILNLDISHFTTQSERSIKSAKPIYTDEQVFCKESDVDTSVVKTRILRQNLLPYLCVECGVTNTYNNKPLNLQLDHKDGDNRNNELSNLRYLCPNCHSQTETYCGRQLKTTVENYCACGSRINRYSVSCRSCSAKTRHLGGANRI